MKILTSVLFAATVLAAPVMPAMARADCVSHYNGNDGDNVLGSSGDPCTKDVFYGGLGNDTLNSGPFTASSTFIYKSREDSVPCCGSTPKYDEINGWHPNDTIDVSKVCAEYGVQCSFDPVEGDPSDGTIGRFYYWYLPIPVSPHWMTAVWGYFGTENHFDFYIAINGGRFALTAGNFKFE